MMISGVLSLVEGVALTLIKAVQTVVDLLFEILIAIIRLVRKALNAAWNIPFVSDLYKRVTGSELTAIDLVAMIVAIPGTVFHKLVIGAAPFPTEQDVEAFKGQFTGPALLSAMGITPPGSAAVEAVAFPQPLVQTMNALNAANIFIYSGMTAYNDMQLPETSPPTELVIANWIAELSMLATGALGQIDTQGGMNFPAGVSNYLYIVQWISAVCVDGGFVFFSEKFPGNVNDAGVNCAWLFGSINLVGTLVEAIVVDLPGPVIATNFLTAVPGFFKALRSTPVVEYTGELSLPALGLIDILLYQTGALVIIGTLNDSTSQRAITAD